MTRHLARADGRPRVHIWPHSAHYAEGACAWSFGPTGRQTEADSPGHALNAAMAALDRRGELVVIVEPVP